MRKGMDNWNRNVLKNGTYSEGEHAVLRIHPLVGKRMKLGGKHLLVEENDGLLWMLEIVEMKSCVRHVWRVFEIWGLGGKNHAIGWEMVRKREILDYNRQKGYCGIEWREVAENSKMRTIELNIIRIGWNKAVVLAITLYRSYQDFHFMVVLFYYVTSSNMTILWVISEVYSCPKRKDSMLPLRMLFGPKRL